MFTSREGPESCLTYNMVKLSAELFRTTGDDAYLAYAERALANHLLSTQHPEHGGVVYFTSMRPGHYRTYSAREEGFWCCVGTGLETHTRHGALAFSTADDELGVNLLIDATARWRDRGTTVRVSSGYPLSERATIEVETTAPARFTLAVRIPTWVDGAASATVDGEQQAPVPAGGRLRLDREWVGVTTIDLELPARTWLEPSPDGGPWAQVLWGPLVLAHRVPDDSVDYVAAPTRMGHIAGGPLRPLLGAPVLGPQSAGSVARTSSGFTVQDVDGIPVALEPFATLHDARYVAAWPYAWDGDGPARRAGLAAVDRGVAQPRGPHPRRGRVRRAAARGRPRRDRRRLDDRASRRRAVAVDHPGPPPDPVQLAQHRVVDPARVARGHRPDGAPGAGRGTGRPRRRARAGGPHAPERPRGRPSAGAARRRDPGRDPRRLAACRPLVCSGCVSWPPRGTDHACAPVTGPV